MRPGVAAAQTTSGWTLVWRDEFNGAAASPPDPTKWNCYPGGAASQGLVTLAVR